MIDHSISCIPQRNKIIILKNDTNRTDNKSLNLMTCKYYYYRQLKQHAMTEVSRCGTNRFHVSLALKYQETTADAESWI